MRVVVGMEMRPILVFVLPAALTLGSASGAEPSRMSLPPTMDKVKATLPSGWRCEGDRGCMVISRQEPVILLNTVSLPAMQSQERLLAEFGVRSHYQIVLLFRPKLADDELQELQAVRNRAIGRARANDEPKHSRSTRAARKILLPTYSYNIWSIYVHRTDGFPLAVYPKEAAAERDAVLQGLDRLFNKDTDPQQSDAPESPIGAESNG